MILLFITLYQSAYVLTWLTKLQESFLRARKAVLVTSNSMPYYLCKILRHVCRSVKLSGNRSHGRAML